MPKKDFLSNFLTEDGRVVRGKKTKNAIDNDQWDRRDYNQLQREMKEFSVSEDQLRDFTPTGGPAMEDQFYSLMKALPVMNDDNEIVPDHYVNKFVAGEAQTLTEYEALRGFSVGDNVSTGLACVKMEPKLEEIFDKLKSASEHMQNIAQMMQQMADLEDQSSDLDQMMAQAAQGSAEFKDAQAQQQLAEQALQKLRDQLTEAVGQAEQEFEDQKLDVRATLKEAMQESVDLASDLDTASFMWGLDSGALQKMPAAKRIELAKRINNDKFRRIAQLFGPMSRMAFAEQKRKTTIARNEVYEIETGNDLTRVLTSEMLAFTDDIMALEAFRKFYESSLLQFKLRGVERLAKGDIVYAFDGSGSMGGDREVWAKAVGLSLLHVARSQKRGFTGVQFGSPGEYIKYEFRKDSCEKLTSEQVSGGKEAARFDFVDGVTTFAEDFLCGGPLRLDQRVVTPDGWKAIGDMEVGDSVYSPNGKPVEVIGVYPQGHLEDVYRVTFKDGAEVICDGAHIWTVTSPNWDGKYRDMTLNEILAKGIRYDHADGHWFNFSVPMSEPVVLDERDYAIEPYLLGYLLGDGTLGGDRSVSIHSSEGEHPWADYLPEGITVTEYSPPTPDRCGSYGLKGYGTGQRSRNVIVDELKRVGLLGVRSADKFVPEEYLWGSINQRFDLLCGLLDSDGCVDSSNGFQFSNTSRALCDAVVHLCQSLGGVATISIGQSRTNEKPHWKVRGRLAPSMGAPFKLSRKAEAYRVSTQDYKRSIVNVEPILPAECICIKVANDDGLFLTEGFVTTHNTDFHTPLSVCLDRLRHQYDTFGESKGDIVFATDGECGVTDSFMQEFKEEQERIGFKIWGIAIDCSPRSEPLNTICDGRVFTIKNLTDGSDIRDIMRGV